MTTPIQTVSYDDFIAYEAEVQTQFDAINARLDGLQSKENPDEGLLLWGTGDASAFKGVRTNMRRLYTGLGNNPSVLKAACQADAARGAWSYVSIGAGSPNAKVLPVFDSQAMGAFLPALQANPRTVFLGIHEPGSSSHPYSTADYIAWMSAAFTFVRKAIPGIRTGVCEMSWTGRNSPDNFGAWMPALGLVDEFCVDGYSHDPKDTAQTLFANALAYAKQISKPLTICEHGSERRLDVQTTWNQSVFEFCVSSSQVKGAAYWNGGNGNPYDYHLTTSAITEFSKLADNERVNPTALPI